MVFSLVNASNWKTEIKEKSSSIKGSRESVSRLWMKRFVEQIGLTPEVTWRGDVMVKIECVKYEKCKYALNPSNLPRVFSQLRQLSAGDCGQQQRIVITGRFRLAINSCISKQYQLWLWMSGGTDNKHTRIPAPMTWFQPHSDSRGEWASSVLRPRQHSIGYMGDGEKGRWEPGYSSLLTFFNA